MRAWLLHRYAKKTLLLLCLLPFVLLLYKVINDNLGPNPAEALIRSTGDWSIRFLCIVLLVTPLKVLTHSPALIRFRRMIGVSVFAYVTLHLLCYAGFDMGFDLEDITKDILKRPFIWVGFLGWVFLSMLALTSTNAAIKWMGVARWRRLHQLVYAVAVLGVVHFYWMKSAKHNFNEVIVYGSILGFLLFWRILAAFKAKFYSTHA